MPLLSVSELAEHLTGLDDDALRELLSARPDLLQPAPGDLLSLAVRAQSELSLRQHLQRLDAHTLRVLLEAAERAAAPDRRPGPDEDHDGRSGTGPGPAPASAPRTGPDSGLSSDAGHTALARLQSHGLVLPAQPQASAAEASGRPAGGDAPAEGEARERGPARPASLRDAQLSVPSNLPHVLESLRLSRAVRGAPTDPPSPKGSAAPSGLVENASLSAVGELLGAVEDLLEVLEQEPAATLRTGGVGMRELRRITAARTGERRTEDPEAGETGWLLELTAAAALIELDVDTGRWQPAEHAAHWRDAARHRRHQLLVSGWLLSPRSPLLLRGPHPSARIAPALTQDRQRGDAPTLRRMVLRVAAELTAEARHRIWELELPDGEPPPDDALRGVLISRLAWERPLLTGRVRPLLAPMVREAERLGLLAAGSVSAAGRALAEGLCGTGSSNAGVSSTGLSSRGLSSTGPTEGEQSAAVERRESLEAMAAVVEGALPPLSETIHLQSDLTAVPAGPPAPELERLLSAVAEKETRGGVPTYRFTASALDAALSRGWTAESLTDRLEQHASGELPSPLRTLIADAARTRRTVRVGAAASWLLEEDPEARAELLAQPELQQLGLRPLQGAVLISEAPPEELTAALRRSGTAVHRHGSSEDDGASGLRAPGPRPAGASPMGRRTTELPERWTLSSSPWQQSPVRTITPEMLAEDPQVLQQAITRLREGQGRGPSGTAPAGAGAEAAGADVVATLREAVRARRPVRIRRAGTDGDEHTLIGVPTAMNAGRVRLRRQDREEESVLLLHRVTSVVPGGPGPDDAPDPDDATVGMRTGSAGVAAETARRHGEGREP